MSTAQNLAYAVVQVAHNFGAVAVVGGSLFALKIREAKARRKLAWLSLAGWGTQAASGAAFGAVTYYYYHQPPDISGIAIVALAIKIVCVAVGFLLLFTYLLRSENRAQETSNVAWITSSALAVTALCAAAFLRWFS